MLRKLMNYPLYLVTNIQFVIARYKEDINYLYKFKNDNILVYNKGPEINTTYPVIKLSNVGKCDHTYLYHIIENYDNLQMILLDYDKHVNGQVLVEINLSCPNLHSSIPGYDIVQVKIILNFLRNFKLNNITFGFKLPPYLQIEFINDLAILFNEFTDILKYIVLSNSIPNCLPLKNGAPILSNTFGGLSGKLNKHIALSNVYSFSKILDKDFLKLFITIF